MFIIIPLALIGVSFLAILVIVWRKLGYLRKLTPEAHEFNHTIFHDFFPELTIALESIQIREYIAIWLHEVEKLIRRIRLLFSKVDRLSDGLLQRIRNIHQRRVAQEAAKEAAEASEESVSKPQAGDYVDVPTVQVKSRRSGPDPVALKSEEQRLIVEIAHDPKNPKLYRDLGDVYMKMKNLEDARESFTTSLKFNPGDEVVQKKLAQVLEKLIATEGNAVEIEK